MTADTPSYWLRQRRGSTGITIVTAAEAERIAQQPGVVGDHTKPAGLVWRVRNPDVRGGWDHYTITPVWESSEPPA